VIYKSSELTKTLTLVLGLLGVGLFPLNAFADADQSSSTLNSGMSLHSDSSEVGIASLKSATYSSAIAPASDDTLIASHSTTNASNVSAAVEPAADNLQEQEQDTQMEQVTSVSQLSDVRPTDWAFQALQSLVERYGCIVGYPDKTYRGNHALSRYEFAAGLNACMDRVNELLAAGTAGLVKKEDLITFQKLQEQFEIGRAHV